MTPTPQASDVISGAVMGFWAFLGAVMRGTADWKDANTGKFSPGRLFASGATALVLGQMASAFGQWQHWEPYAISALASAVGWLGPAATMQLFQKRFLGNGNAIIPAVLPPKE
jgi:hypothetical protein